MRDSNLTNKQSSVGTANDVSANTLSSEQVEALFKSVDDLVFVLDAERNFIKCFQPESSELMMPHVLFIGKNLSVIPFPSDVMLLVQNAFDAAAATGLTQSIDYCLVVNDKERWYNSKISKISTVDKLDGFIVVARDITDRIKSLQLLEANEKKYHLLADNTTDLVALYSTGHLLEYISPSVYNLLGFKPADLTGKDVSPYIHPEDLAFIQQHFIPEAYNGNAFFSTEYRLMHAKGYWVYFSTTRKPIRNEDGVITHILACCRDITERVKSEKALKKSEVNYKILADNILDLVGLHNVEGVFEYVSPSSLNVLGYTPEELVGKNAFELIHPEESATLFEKNRNKAAEGTNTFIDEFRILHKEGHYVHFETTTNIIRDEENKPINFLSTSRDITEWKKAQCALKESEEKYRGLVENSDNIIAMIDKDYHYLFVNSQAAAFIGARIENIIGKKLGEVLHSGQEHMLIENIGKVIESGQTIRSEHTLIVSDKQYWVRVSYHPIRDTEGKIYAVLLNAIDISNLKKTESLLAEQNKGLKEIAFLQSHVLRSPLSNIKHLISLMDKKALSDENKIILDLLQTSAENLDDIVKQIVEKTYLSSE